jgi:hypothetical protein
MAGSFLIIVIIAIISGGMTSPPMMGSFAPALGPDNGTSVLWPIEVRGQRTISCQLRGKESPSAPFSWWVARRDFARRLCQAPLQRRSAFVRSNETFRRLKSRRFGALFCGPSVMGVEAPVPNAGRKKSTDFANRHRGLRQTADRHEESFSYRISGLLTIYGSRSIAELRQVPPPFTAAKPSPCQSV